MLTNVVGREKVGCLRWLTNTKFVSNAIEDLRHHGATVDDNYKELRYNRWCRAGSNMLLQEQKEGFWKIEGSAV